MPGLLPVVEFPDVELWASGYLRTELPLRPEAYAAGVFVGNYVPKPRWDRMVVVRRDGGPRISTVLEVARLSVRVWGSSEQEASDLARLVRALLWASPDGDPVVKVTDLSGPSPIPDDQPLRFMTLEVTVRGATAAVQHLFPSESLFPSAALFPA